jgi:hypothetical protein
MPKNLPGHRFPFLWLFLCHLPHFEVWRHNEALCTQWEWRWPPSIRRTRTCNGSNNGGRFWFFWAAYLVTREWMTSCGDNETSYIDSKLLMGCTWCVRELIPKVNEWNGLYLGRKHKSVVRSVDLHLDDWPFMQLELHEWLWLFFFVQLGCELVTWVSTCIKLTEG